MGAVNPPVSTFGALKKGVTDLFDNQPVEYQDPTWVQKRQTQWDNLTPTWRKVIKVAFPIIVTVTAVGGGVLAAYLAPEGWDKTLGTAIMLNVGGFTFGGLQLAIWRWGKSYSEQMLKVDENKDKPDDQKLNEQDLWTHRLDHFKANNAYFRDFDSSHVNKGGQLRPLWIAQILAQCPQARTVTLNTDYDKPVLNELVKLQHLKRLNINFSPKNGVVCSTADLLAAVDCFPLSVRHINLNMPPPTENIAGEDPEILKKFRLPSEFFEKLFQRLPNLKTFQATNMDPDSWAHFKHLNKIKDLTIEVERLEEFTEPMGRHIVEFRNKVVSNPVQFKQLKIIHKKHMQDKTGKNSCDYHHYDKFPEPTRRIIEDKINTEDQDGQDHDKRTMSLYFAKTMRERWDALFGRLRP